MLARNVLRGASAPAPAGAFQRETGPAYARVPVDDAGDLTVDLETLAKLGIVDVLRNPFVLRPTHDSVGPQESAPKNPTDRMDREWVPLTYAG